MAGSTFATGRRTLARLLAPLLCLALAGCASTPLRGTGDLGVVIERASGSVQIVDNSHAQSLARVQGLGDLSHASVVFSRDARYAYVFGRDGAISKVDLLAARLVKRVEQASNSIGGAISSDGRVIAAQNYSPGGVKLFDADNLQLLSSVSTAAFGGGESKVVGLADMPGNRFAFALYDSGEIWLLDASTPSAPKVQRFEHIGKQPYDGLASSDGRYFIAGLYGEDGLALFDSWHADAGVRRILAGYGRGRQALPVYKMPHLRGWSIAGDYAFLPAIGQHEVLVADNRSWAQVATVPVLGQPVFVMAEPGGRRVWVNFAFPDNDKVQVIDVPTRQVIKTLQPGRAILHMEFTPRGDAVWLSSRDDNKLLVIDTATLTVRRTLPALEPSGIFFSSRASRMGM
ncbi:cytochrome D1 domain-containing protein [Aquitalea aquatica]|uniref:Protein nirF n=1 Tax=Aquitalea aquatica TaxID=3044273 RepID=A0A838Y830_9NEIS|nr:cytochrome D1 domain-containing protein [Aquitalea magnusonii]MBA4706954.1 protein nirF [Aquitalea magnusonii]